MSTTKLFRAGLIATVGVAGLTLSANAQSRYGNVYDYESGRNCGQACVPAAPMTPQSHTRYGAPVVSTPAYNPAPVYVDCVQAGTCAPQPSVVYTQPTYTQPSYTQPTYSQPSYTQSVQQMAPVNCPSGTTAQADGTCMQSSSYSSSTSTSTYSGSTYSEPAVSMEPANCPSGTTAQSDGTCMQSSSSSYSSGSTYSSESTYSEPSYSSYSSPSVSMGAVNCPSGTTAQSDGTCMQGGSNSYVGSSVELYTGDATTSSSSTSSYGYSSDGSYGSSDYLPIRK